MKQKIINFLKGIYKEILLLLCVIAFLIFIAVNKKTKENQAAEYAKLETKLEQIEKDRAGLLEENTGLVRIQMKLQKEIDSIKAVQRKDKKYYDYVIAKNKKEIDSLLKVPNDSIYKRLQPIYPNYDTSPLQYPFSGSQIRQVYTTAIQYPRLITEFNLQSNILSTCNSLNKKYELSEINYQDQIKNLNQNIIKCDEQVSLRTDELNLVNKKLKRKTFWSYTKDGVIIILTAIAIVK